MEGRGYGPILVRICIRDQGKQRRTPVMLWDLSTKISTRNPYKTKQSADDWAETFGTRTHAHTTHRHTPHACMVLASVAVVLSKHWLTFRSLKERKKGRKEVGGWGWGVGVGCGVVAGSNIKCYRKRKMLRVLTHWGRGHLNCLNAHSRGF